MPGTTPSRVTQRREQHIDRRAAARLLLIEGAAFGAYLVILMLIFPPGTGMNVAVLIAPFLIWTQLATTLRDEYGYQPRGREQRLRSTVVIIVLLMVCGALLTVFLDIDLPSWARPLPGVLSFVLYAVLAWDEYRRASVEAIRRGRTPFTRAVRVQTIGIGVVLGVIIASAASPALIAAIATAAVMIALAAWLLTTALTGGSTAATAWGVFHWICFAAAGAVVAVLLLLMQYSTLPLTAVGYVLGALIAIAFVVGALVVGALREAEDV
ncbi:hypothetical protein WDU99_16355 [Microbacterium sp. Mu-80]|uniref:Integral membrane protein n=1 Tax=Microbacterium bandirmense TaxID=3122050 RepID=A0ABU8LFV4_9MICO